jgi:hypothetical protein
MNEAARDFRMAIAIDPHNEFAKSKLAEIKRMKMTPDFGKTGTR